MVNVGKRTIHWVFGYDHIYQEIHCFFPITIDTPPPLTQEKKHRALQKVAQFPAVPIVDLTLQ